MDNVSNVRIAILRLLYENPEGKGYNEIKNEAPAGEKSMRLWIPKLRDEEKLIMVEPKGIKHIHKLTSKGREYVERNIVTGKFLKEVLRLYGAYTEEKKLEVLGIIFKDLYEYFRESFLSGERSNALKVFREAIGNPAKEYLNRELLDMKESILNGEHYEMSYYHPNFRLRELAIGFVLEDAKLAWKNEHFLNTHHRYVFEKFGLHSRKEVKERNQLWDKKHPYGSDPSDAKQKEIEKRVKIFKSVKPSVPNIFSMLPNTFFRIPDDYGQWYGDVY